MATASGLPSTTTRHDYVQLGGGLDLLTPLLKLKSGYVRDALNWEQAVNGGYGRINGYERFDGKAAPSSAVYFTLQATLVSAVAAGNTIVGATSAATGTVLSVDTSSGVTVIAYTQATGVFVATENIKVGVPVVGSVIDVGGAGTSPDYDVTQRALAADVYRALIAAVPGSGPVRGGFKLAGGVYAFRNNAGGTALLLYKASGASWTLVPFINEVAFTAGSGTPPATGATLTQGANSATMRRLSTESGSWAAGTAAGRFIVTTPVPGNFAAGALTGGATATLSGAQTAIVMAPGGRVDSDFGNFDGTVRVYGWDGVNRGFEFDGTTLVPIATGNTPDTPNAGRVHKDHLWFAFGTNLQNSGIVGNSIYGGAPFTWTAIAGSVAYRMNGTVNALLRMPGDQSTGTLAVITAVDTSFIYGSSAADFRKVDFEQSAGGRPWGAQRLGGQSFAFGDIGVFSLAATQAYGNFTPSAMTMNIRPFTSTRKTLANATLTNREKSQYRVFFSDGYGLYLTIVNGKLLGAMPVFFPNKVVTAWAGDTAIDSTEDSYFGSDNGFVYRLDSGTSHDGSAITGYLTLTFANQGNSRMLKRYKRATFEVQGDGYATFDVTYEVGYGGGDRPQGTTPTTAAVALAAAYWDTGGSWDSLTWDGKTLAPSTVELSGTGENIALRIDSSSQKYAGFTINSTIIDYIPRRGLRQ